MRDVLRAYVSLFDFKGLPFDASFRRFLEQFRLPGEAQCIDRIMEQVTVVGGASVARTLPVFWFSAH